MNLEKRIEAFGKLSGYLISFQENNSSDDNNLAKALNLSSSHNQWFTIDTILFSIASIAKSIEKQSIENWVENYKFPQALHTPIKIGVVMAGNIPLVGFHDFFYVLISGNHIIAKLSSDDKHLLPAIAGKLIEFDPEFADFITFTEDKLENFDAIIATGSNNTAKYFEYYFGKYPHIIRKNRNGVAVLSGNETKEELAALSNDITRYFGMGCRSISKLYAPENYNFNNLLASLSKHNNNIDTTKYCNNYEYYKSIYLINSLPFYDNGSVILKEEKSISSPISVIYYEFYDKIENLNSFFSENTGQIQCIVSNDNAINGAIPFGSAQSPTLMNYADGVDVMDFLLKISK